MPVARRELYLDHGRVFAEEKMRALIIALVLVLTGCAAHGPSQGQPYVVHFHDRGGKG
jgi:hypothetical protein